MKVFPIRLRKSSFKRLQNTAITHETSFADADVPVVAARSRPLPLPVTIEGCSTQQGSLEDRSSDGSLDIASIPPPPPPVLAQDDSLEGVGEADVEEAEELSRPRPQPPPPPRTLSRISEGSFSRQMGSSGDRFTCGCGRALRPEVGCRKFLLVYVVPFTTL